MVRRKCGRGTEEGEGGIGGKRGSGGRGAGREERYGAMTAIHAQGTGKVDNI